MKGMYFIALFALTPMVACAAEKTKVASDGSSVTACQQAEALNLMYPDHRDVPQNVIALAKVIQATEALCREEQHTFAPSAPAPVATVPSASPQPAPTSSPVPAAAKVLKAKHKKTA